MSRSAYVRERPGELLHIDVKKLGRIPDGGGHHFRGRGQGIRGGANRKVIERIKESGDLFLAWSDEPWILDGAAVHISFLAYDDGSETTRELDGRPVAAINANLTAALGRDRRRDPRPPLGPQPLSAIGLI